MSRHHTYELDANGDTEPTFGKVVQWLALAVGAGISAVAAYRLTGIADGTHQVVWQLLWVIAILIVTIAYVIGGMLHDSEVESRRAAASRPSRRMQRWLVRSG